MDSSIIIFDIGQVLVKFNRTRTIESLSRYGKISKESNLPLNIVRDYETGRLSDMVFYEEICRAMSLSCPYREFFKGWNNMFTRPVRGIDELLKTLSRNYRLMALTNTCPSHIKYLKRKFAFFKYFRCLITSYELGFMKPDLRMYETAERKYFPGKKPLAYIDDLPENVMSAERMGWPCHRFEDMAKLKAFLKSKAIL